jgi:hypothetical protein
MLWERQNGGSRSLLGATPGNRMGRAGPAGDGQAGSRSYLAAPAM